MDFGNLPQLRLPPLPEQPERFATLAEVFGISRSIPLNYVSREAVDTDFAIALDRNRHIVVHGSSKQGKTCLRKWNLDDDAYVTITCSNRWTIANLHTSILKQAGFTVSQSETRTVSGENKITAKTELKIAAPGVDASSSIEGARGASNSHEVVRYHLDLDPSDVNEVVSAIRQIDFRKHVVLEDFHYLPRETQQDFAVALKALHESSELTVIIVGVWLDENKLVQFNGDLTGRVVAINADAWTRDQLRQVMEGGAELLGITFTEEFILGVLDRCFDSVWVVQEACFRACLKSNVIADRADHTAVGADLDVDQLIVEIIDQQSARYSTFIPAFAEGFRSSHYELYKWILCAVLLSDVSQLTLGLNQADIRDFINNHHPLGSVLSSNLASALRSVVQLQAERIGIKPTIFDFDESSRRLTIVDRSFLIWLEHLDTQDLLEEAGMPAAFIRRWVSENGGEPTGRHRQ
ncbi:MAG: hypothetical protein AVDCRST_MAG66-3475 [uncultured Pseudonocardia sp.]|uniref:Uncharacterized protein n=1 Tax=uncultured Pseudonocardia sp. TaxID=211455 RepID=A0A6J4Q4E3_9PSEU|nr:MAG: hypothetical protein AVDCRST_MAG66-3475 [uncultured Pseudonocardia sp.]